jgi:O-antigen/teichoic acid export membrane protein
VTQSGTSSAPSGFAAVLRRLAGATGGRTDALFSFAVRFGGAVFTFVSQVLIARWMGLTEFGAFSNAWVWVTLAGTLVQLGLASSSTRFAAAALETGDRGTIRGVVIFSQLAVLALSIAVTVAVAFAAGLPQTGFTASQREALLIGCLCIPVFAQIDIGKGIARVDGPAWLAYAPGFLLRPLLFLAILAIAQMLGLAIDAAIAVWAMLAALVLTWLVQRLIIHRQVGPLVKGTKPVFAPGTWLGGSYAIVLVDGYFMAVTSIDVLLLNALASPQEGGAYYAASRTTALVSYIVFAVSAVSSAQMARLHAGGRHEELAALVRKFTRWTFWPTLAAGVGIAVAGPFLLGLFGPGFTSAYPVMLVLMLGLVVQASAGSVRFLLLMSGRQNALALRLGACIAIALVLNLLLIPVWGATGAAIATALTMTLATAAMVSLARRELGITSLIGF